MLETKMFEIRDRATFFVAYATRAVPTSPRTDADIHEKERYLLQRDGFSSDIGPLVILYRSNQEAHYDPHYWGDRTYNTAHQYITDNWHMLESGDVIDVEFILGEKPTAKLSERITNKELF
jgi:hypothetical protein